MGFTTVRMERILQSKGVTDMGHLDVPEVLIALGVAALFGWRFTIGRLAITITDITPAIKRVTAQSAPESR